jgi:mono/diheme cytochrome c family protein
MQRQAPRAREVLEVAVAENRDVTTDRNAADQEVRAGRDLFSGTFSPPPTPLRNPEEELPMNRKLTLILSTMLAACGSAQTQESETQPAAPTTATAGGEAPQTFAEQVALGQQLYAANCAGCHGDNGQNGKAPHLVGLQSGALPLDPPAGAKYRTGQFKTVADVANFVVANMPPKKAGSLSEEQYFSILAFDLKANGIDLGDKKLDAPLAATLDIPR